MAKTMKKQQTYILAEMAASHEGDLEKAIYIVESSAKAGADGISLQLIDLDTYIVPEDEDYEDTKSFYMEQDKWLKIIKKCNDLNLEIWANVYDLKSAEFCKDKKIKGYKLHSSNLENRALLKFLIKTGKEIALSVGGMDEEDIRQTVLYLYSIDKKIEIHLMYGMQNFPTDVDDVNINFIKKVSKDLDLVFGYQDHSEPESPASIYLPILFISNGATIIEKHVTHDRSYMGQDHEAALNPVEFIEFVKHIRTVDKIVNKDISANSAGFRKYRKYKSIIKVIAKKNISEKDVFNGDNISVMRSKKGQINGRYISKLIGKKASFSYKKYDPIKIDEIIKTGIFITARLKSKRLKQKVIKPILGKPMINWMIERLKHSSIRPIILMTSTNLQDDPLIEISKENNIAFFRGSEDDVLERIKCCAEEFDIDLVISVTADDPLKEISLMDTAVEIYLDEKYDFLNIDGLPNGCEFYALSSDAVKKVCEIKADEDTEIWGPYFLNKQDIFKCKTLKIKDPQILRPGYRVTVDTPKDFELVAKIFEMLIKEKDFFDAYDICRLLDNNPELIKINADVKQRQKNKVNYK